MASIPETFRNIVPDPCNRTVQRRNEAATRQALQEITNYINQQFVTIVNEGDTASNGCFIRGTLNKDIGCSHTGPVPINRNGAITLAANPLNLCGKKGDDVFAIRDFTECDSDIADAEPKIIAIEQACDSCLAVFAMAIADNNFNCSQIECTGEAPAVRDSGFSFVKHGRFNCDWPEFGTVLNPFNFRGSGGDEILLMRTSTTSPVTSTLVQVEHRCFQVLTSIGYDAGDCRITGQFASISVPGCIPSGQDTTLINLTSRDMIYDVDYGRKVVVDEETGEERETDCCELTYKQQSMCTFPGPAQPLPVAKTCCTRCVCADLPSMFTAQFEIPENIDCQDFKDALSGGLVFNAVGPGGPPYDHFSLDPGSGGLFRSHTGDSKEWRTDFNCGGATYVIRVTCADGGPNDAEPTFPVFDIWDISDSDSATIIHSGCDGIVAEFDFDIGSGGGPTTGYCGCEGDPLKFWCIRIPFLSAVEDLPPC